MNYPYPELQRIVFTYPGHPLMSEPTTPSPPHLYHTQLSSTKPRRQAQPKLPGQRYERQSQSATRCSQISPKNNTQVTCTLNELPTPSEAIYNYPLSNYLLLTPKARLSSFCINRLQIRRPRSYASIRTCLSRQSQSERTTHRDPCVPSTDTDAFLASRYLQEASNSCRDLRSMIL